MSPEHQADLKAIRAAMTDPQYNPESVTRAAVALLDEIANRDAELAKLRQHYPAHELELCRASGLLTGAMLLTTDEILAGARLCERDCGVYFLIVGEEIVYVGQSTSIMSRIAQHKTRIQFSRYAFAPFAERHLDLAESLYIHLLRPRMNGFDAIRGVRRPAAPIALERLLDMAIEAEKPLPQPAPSTGQRAAENACVLRE